MAVTQILPPVQPAAAADDTNTAHLQLQLRCIAGIPRFSRALKTLGAGVLDPLAVAKYGTFPKAGYWVPKQAFLHVQWGALRFSRGPRGLFSSSFFQ